MGGDETGTLTIDDLAAAAGTTTRRVRSLQTLGLVPHPDLRGRTGLYGERHQARLESVLQLQARGFSLESLVVLFDALDAGRSLDSVLGSHQPVPARDADDSTDSAELYGFAQLQPAGSAPRRGQPLLSVVPTTVWDEHQAS